MQRFDPGRAHPGEGNRAHGLAIPGVEVHVLAPAMGFDDVDPCPTGFEGPRGLGEFQVEFVSRAEDHHRVVQLGGQLLHGAEAGVISLHETDVPKGAAAVVIVMGLALGGVDSFGKPDPVEAGTP